MEFTLGGETELFFSGFSGFGFSGCGMNPISVTGI